MSGLISGITVRLNGSAPHIIHRDPGRRSAPGVTAANWSAGVAAPHCPLGELEDNVEFLEAFLIVVREVRGTRRGQQVRVQIDEDGDSVEARREGMAQRGDSTQPSQLDQLTGLGRRG